LHRYPTWEYFILIWRLSPNELDRVDALLRAIAAAATGMA